jgi:phosphate transport system ATP-binding protein
MPTAPDTEPNDVMTDHPSQPHQSEGNAAPEVASAARPSTRLGELASGHEADPAHGREVVFELDRVTIAYRDRPAIRDVDLAIHQNLVTAFIGPSGCGKTTLLRSMNRLNDLVPGASVEGSIRYHGHDLNADEVDAVEVRRRIGMVFQRPNPFPKSIYDNVAFGLRLHGMKDDLNDRVERALTQAALWDEVKDRLKTSALSLSGGQQQRLCIARALAIEPDVVLMDEPASALDPISTQAIEDLVESLKSAYTIIIVTHNMQQAARVADLTAFFSVEVADEGNRCGVLVEMGPTSSLFIRPSDPRTEAYVTGRFG